MRSRNTPVLTPSLVPPASDEAPSDDRAAEARFEQALVVDPKNLSALDSLITLATAACNWERVIRFRTRRAAALDDDLDERASELLRIADVLQLGLQDKRRAADVLESAALARPGDRSTLIRLKHLYEDLRQWPELLDVLDELYRISDDARDRGTYRFEQAVLACRRLSQEARGLAFLELALDEDPQHDRALEMLVDLRMKREEWLELAHVYERLVDRLAGLGDRKRAWDVCRKLGALRRGGLIDMPGALEAFRGAIELVPEDVESRAVLAELLVAKGDRSAAVRELEIVTAHAPFRVKTYARLYDLHVRAQRADHAWLVATVLEALGAAEPVHTDAIRAGRTDAPIRPAAAVDEAAWSSTLRAKGGDPIVDDILRIVSSAAIAIALEDRATDKKRKGLELDPANKQDERTTASVVRTFRWAARALGIPAPDLYTMPAGPSGIAAVPGPTPAVALGPEVQAGKKVQELAFLAGRHLAYYRAEHYALVFFPTLGELSSLVLSAVAVVVPGIDLPSKRDRSLVLALETRLTPPQRLELSKVIARLDARGGKLDLLGWIRHVELTAARAGLLLAGDLRVALQVLEEEKRTIGELTLEEKRGDLLMFTASAEYASLRARIGAAG